MVGVPLRQEWLFRFFRRPGRLQAANLAGRLQRRKNRRVMGSPATPCTRLTGIPSSRGAAVQQRRSRAGENSQLAAFPDGLVQGQQVFRRRGRLHVVHRVEHESAAAVKNFDPLANLARRICSGVPKGRVFCVSTPPPQKVSLGAEPLFQRLRVHAHRRTLHRVEDVETRLDDVRQQG